MNESELIKYAIEYLLEADLRAGSGWTIEDIRILEKLRTENFKVVFENKQSN